VQGAQLLLQLRATLALEGVYCRCDLLYKAAGDKLIHPEVSPAVRTGLSGLVKPLLDADRATELGTEGTHDRVLHLVIADEALEDLLNVATGAT
jgi:hypothetical protein